MRSASEDMEFLDLSYPTDTIPAVFSHLSEVFHAVEVNWYVLSLLLGCFFTCGKSLVDIVNAGDLFVMGAVVVGGDCSFFEEGE